MYIPTWGLVVLVVLIFWFGETRVSRTDLDELAVRLENAIKDIAEKRKELQEEADDLRTDVDALQSELDSLQSEANSLETNVDSLRSDVDSLRNDLDDLGASGDSSNVIQP
jgi:peptidoglycan hydrolase CwlO-like protein